MGRYTGRTQMHNIVKNNILFFTVILENFLNNMLSIVGAASLLSKNYPQCGTVCTVNFVTAEDAIFVGSDFSIVVRVRVN